MGNEMRLLQEKLLGREKRLQRMSGAVAWIGRGAGRPGNDGSACSSTSCAHHKCLALCMQGTPE